MPDTVYKRNGPMWSQHIFLVTNKKQVYSLLVGENMNNISVFEILQEFSHEKTGRLISKGRLRNVKTTDQGYPARALIYIPNRKTFPDQDKIMLSIATINILPITT